MKFVIGTLSYGIKAYCKNNDSNLITIVKYPTLEI